MARLDLVAILIFLVSASTWSAEAHKKHKKDVLFAWSRSVREGTEVIKTTLKFYVHDKLSGVTPTALKIAQSLQTNNYSTSFGSLFMVDDPMTIGPDPSSKVVGRARGLYGSCGQMDLSLIMVLTFSLTDGIYNGSSFSILSMNEVLQHVREMAVVGGTGLFRLAHGYLSSSTYKIDPETSDGILSYNVTLITHA